MNDSQSWQTFSISLGQSKLRSTSPSRVGTLKTPDFFEFVRQLSKQSKSPIILVCDRYSVHRSTVQKLQKQEAR